MSNQCVFFHLYRRLASFAWLQPSTIGQYAHIGIEPGFIESRLGIFEKCILIYTLFRQVK